MMTLLGKVRGSPLFHAVLEEGLATFVSLTLTPELAPFFVAKSTLPLQGRHSTWYTGTAWASPFQTELWEFNERLLPVMLGQRE